MAEVLDTFTDDKIKLINFVSSSRVGKTETLTNMMGYAIDQQPGTWLQVYPTQRLAERACDRVHDAIMDSPRWKQHVIDAGWKTKTSLSLDQMKIEYGWAGSPTTLIDITCRNIGFDEVDNCEIESGQLGNTLRLAMERVATWGSRAMCVATTTPKFKEGSAWRMWEASDKRHFHVPCPKCGFYQVLQFQQIKVPADERDKDVILEKDLAYYECIECKYKIRDRYNKRAWMVERGVWVAECQSVAQRLPVNRRAIVKRSVVGHPDRWTPEIEGVKSINPIAGFHMWSAYSPWRSLSEIMYQFFSVKDNPDEFRVFINQWLGEPWKEAIDEIDESVVKKKRYGSYPPEMVPLNVRCLAAGADVQKTHIYYVIRGWAEFRKSYLIKHGTCAEFAELYEIMRRDYTSVDGKFTLNPRLLAIDSAYRTEDVYDFSNKYPGIYPVKGQSGVLYNVKNTTIFYTKTGKKDLSKAKLWHVNTEWYKESLIKSMNTAPGDPGEWCIHRETTDDYCTQITSEHQVWKTTTIAGAKRRKPVWEPKTTGAANHYLDAEIYLLALADFWGMTKLMPIQPKIKKTKTRMTTERFLQQGNRNPPT